MYRPGPGFLISGSKHTGQIRTPSTEYVASLR